MPVSINGSNTPTAGGAVYGDGTAYATTAAGTAGQVLTSAGASAPTWATLAPAGSRSFTASGAIASAGLPVALNANGTVSTVATTAGSAAITLTNTTSTTANRGRVMMFSSTSNVYVAIYRTDSGARIEAIAGTLSGTTFTWGTAVEVAPSSDYCGGAWDAVNNKFVVVNVTTASNMDAYVLTVSGTTISVGAVTNIETGGNVGARPPSVAYEPTSGKMALLYLLGTSAYVRVGTVSGTTSSWTAVSAALYAGNNAKNFQAYAVNGLVVFSATRNTSTNYIYLQVGTISGTTLTLGTYAQHTPTGVDFGTVIFSPVYNTYYWCGQDLNASAFLSILPFTITSALSVAITETIIATTVPIVNGSNFSSAYDPIANRVVIGYSAVTTSYGTVVSMLNPNVLGSPVTVQSLVAAAASFSQGTLIYSSTAGKVVGATVGTSNRVYGAVITTEASSNTNTIGLSTEAVSDGASASCTIIGGVNTGVSGLTTGLNYYASPTGTLTTSPASNFLLGRALSATSLLVTNGTFP